MYYDIAQWFFQFSHLLFDFLNCFIVHSFEMWSFELLTLFAGLLPNPQLQTSVLSVW